MGILRRDLLKRGGAGVAGAALAAVVTAGASGTATANAESTAVPGSPDSKFDVRRFGAKGDGKAIDSPAINKAIEAAAAVGGGMVHLPAGQYLCYSIHLKSNVGLWLGPGSVIIAADSLPPGVSGGYDDPESNQPWEAYQDFGHNHWHNSLIWGVGLHDISITGPGRIWGRGLSRSNGPDNRNPADRRTQGVGNKSIGLKNCHNVLLKDFQILKGGWFGILATGVDNFTIDNLTIDTNRDGMDIDCCRNVHISNCSVNSPRDDGIVLKSSYALGEKRSCENITIAGCYVTGAYAVGSVLDGTWKSQGHAGTGRIKFGTESNGGFKNIAITNCVFDGCRGFALESVDGAILEDVAISNITMRNIESAPIFIRLGARLRGPSGTTVGAIRRVTISGLVSSNAGSKLCSIISGIPGHPVEDVRISDFYLQQQGGGTRADAAIKPPENEKKYPEPGMFGAMPAQGFFLRNVKNFDLSDGQFNAIQPDERPAFVLDHVDGADFFRVRFSTPQGVPGFVLNDVKNFEAARTGNAKDIKIAETNHKEI